jgi:hypothetical protein
MGGKMGGATGGEKGGATGGAKGGSTGGAKGGAKGGVTGEATGGAEGVELVSAAAPVVPKTPSRNKMGARRVMRRGGDAAIACVGVMGQMGRGEASRSRTHDRREQRLE